MKILHYILPVLIIIALAYARHTYILNPNMNGKPMVIQLRQSAQLLDDSGPSASPGVRSILVFWAFFLLANYYFFYTYFGNSTATKLALVIYFAASSFSALLFGLHLFVIHSPVISSLASIVKNFLLSPIFTAAGYIIIRYQYASCGLK